MDRSDAKQTTIWGAVGRPESSLRKLYEDDGYSISQLAQLFDCSTTAICDDLCSLGLLDADELFPDRLPRFRTYDKYEFWEHGRHRVRVHRLLMVAEHGFEAVADAAAIHHESFPWDNRIDALILCATRKEHQDLHDDRLDGDHEDQQTFADIDYSSVSSEEPEESGESEEIDVEMENQRTFDEFVQV